MSVCLNRIPIGCMARQSAVIKLKTLDQLVLKLSAEFNDTIEISFSCNVGDRA